MPGPAPGTDPARAPAAELEGSLQQALADLADVASWAPSVTTEADADRATKILDRLGAELVQAAIDVQRIPAR